MNEVKAKFISVICMMLLGFLGASICGTVTGFDKTCTVAILSISVAASLYIVFKEKNNE